MEYFFVGMFMVWAGLLSLSYLRLSRRLNWQQKQLDSLKQISKIPQELKAQLAALKEGGDSIRAIKRLREETGLSLPEAKAYVDGL